MPKCRNCGTRLSKLDNDICPVCGIDSPLEGVVSETIEITSNINMGDKNYVKYTPRSRALSSLLFILCGFTGSGLFYLKFIKQGILWCLANIMIIVAAFLLLFFIANLGLLLSLLIPFAASYAINIAFGLFIIFKKNIKDGNGEFIR